MVHTVVYIGDHEKYRYGELFLFKFGQHRIHSVTNEYYSASDLVQYQNPPESRSSNTPN